MKNKETQTTNPNELPLAKINYIIIAASIMVLVIGFLLMSGGASENPTQEFNYEMFSARRIIVAPIVLLIGFAGVGVGVMKRFNK